MQTCRPLFLLTACVTLRAASVPQEAESALFAAKYDRAAEIYAKLLHADPAWAPGYYGMVRALIGAYRAPEAYAAAEMGLERAPESAEVLTAAGLAAYRRGDLAKAEQYFRQARQSNPNYAYALSGLASVDFALSKFRSGQRLIAQAYRAAPDDPRIIAAWAHTVEGAEHIAALERALAIYDPASRDAHTLRAHLSIDKATGNRKLRRLVSPYQGYNLKLTYIRSGARDVYGVGLQVRLNGARMLKLLLDTGAFGISVSAKAAAKSGLERLSDESTEVRGIGDSHPRVSFPYMAATVSSGDLEFADYPVQVLEGTKTTDYDGLIGADVFQLFRVAIDFQNLQLNLGAYASGPNSADAPVDAPDTLPDGFCQMLRFGHGLTVRTSVNEGPARLFLVDSGSGVDLVDTAIAREATKVAADEGPGLSGIQGRVEKLWRVRRITLLFAGLRHENPNLLAASLDGLGDASGVGIAGLLGMPVLWDMKVTIDYRNGAMRFERQNGLELSMR